MLSLRFGEKKRKKKGRKPPSRPNSISLRLPICGYSPRSAAAQRLGGRVLEHWQKVSPFYIFFYGWPMPTNRSIG
ncbi:hypothetical protein RchiOBHm_Chr7g0232671 [Rosa chinensis]|uniref:Uncharacterized protein n=1 Tax=Rosa chinensis TaxID=74649 RepID=A0A2P6PFZ2_ROSCH|nr:hypothetical protein RchiOBHm_Chr7g0232671 [Rosa chinensis]